jgi:hypothetical protein
MNEKNGLVPKWHVHRCIANVLSLNTLNRPVSPTSSGSAALLMSTAGTLGEPAPGVLPEPCSQFGPLNRLVNSPLPDAPVQIRIDFAGLSWAISLVQSANPRPTLGANVKTCPAETPLRIRPRES